MNNKRTSKVKNTILFVIVIAFLIAIIGDTYSRYVSKGTVNASSQMAKWNITINNEDISSQTFEIAAVDNGTNENVKSGTLAPGKDLVASLEVNPSGSEVAVDYSLGIGELNLGSNFDDDSVIGITKVTATVDGGSEVQLSVSNNAYDYFENLDNILGNKKVTFKVYIGWTNQGTDEGDAADTANVAELTTITIPVTITARQHIGIVKEMNTSSAGDLTTMNEGLNVGDKVILTESITYDDYAQYPTSGWKRVEFPTGATFDMKGQTITSPNGAFAYVGDDLTIKDGNFVGLISSAGGRYGMHLWNETNNCQDISRNVVVENVTTTGICLYNTEVTLKNVTVTIPDDAKYYAVYGNVYSTITIESGTYTAGAKTTALFGYLGHDASEAGCATENGDNPLDGFVIKGGTFITNGKPLFLTSGSHRPAIIQGGAFDVNVTSYIDTTAYQCVQNPSTGLWEVSAI